MFPRRGGGPLGIRHEDHSTHRGDGTTTNALKGSLGSFAVPSPIVGIDDEKTGLASVTIGLSGQSVHCCVSADGGERPSVVAFDRCAEGR